MTTRRNSLLSRRSLLRGAGMGGLGLGLGLPFLSSLMARAGGVGTPAKRVIFFCTPNESVDRAHWVPPGGGAEFPLTGLKPMMASLEPHMERLLLIGDLHMKSRMDDPHPGGHIGMGHLLVGRRVTELGPSEPEHWASGKSLDQHIAEELGVNALTLGVRSGGSNGNSRISYLGDSQPVDPIARPDTAFDNLFADSALPAEELAALKARRLSVLDRVSGDLDRLKASLPSEGREKLDVHTSMVRDLELKIAADQVVDCEPVGPGGGDYDSNAGFPTAVRRQIDVMLQALGCGITDVASLQVGNSGASNVTPIWPEEGIDINIDYHNIVHDYNNDAGNATIKNRREQMETFMFSLFAYLLDQMEQIPEGTGSMLDNSLVVWMKPIAWKHRFDDFLFMLAGNAGGSLQTGRFMSFPERPHNDLLVSVMNLMGIAGNSYGDPQYCTGALPIV
jgi:hypothetical protein